MTTIEQQTARAAEYPAGVPLHERIARFYGNHHDFLLWLIANPSRPQTEGMRKLGLAEETLYSWRRDIAGFKEVVDTIQEHRHDLRAEYAKAAFLEATPGLADAMVKRGLGDGVAAQRAGERILETVGVLKPQGPVVNVDARRIDSLALSLLQREAQAVPLPEATEAVFKALPEPPTVSDST